MEHGVSALEDVEFFEAAQEKSPSEVPIAFRRILSRDILKQSTKFVFDILPRRAHSTCDERTPFPGNRFTICVSVRV